ncbi:TlpA disulfide reductase family protein [Aureitalea marina]|uniref:Redoxin n=1 Tax=Aureitalea marina TaxID=930804 RepID=A0A2S7KTJ4_9FLAO|nr:TlpA disulfide reductase family protein [Aureitalea marina]PQB05940.1 redoxin [Aureitalea marina]
MRPKILILVVLISSVLGCQHATSELDQGLWLLTFHLDNGHDLPVNVEVGSDGTLTFVNAEERVSMEQPIYQGDSVYIMHPVFEGYFKGKLQEGELEGVFVKESLDRIVPFNMIKGDYPRFQSSPADFTAVSGRWESVFSPDSDEDRYPAMGLFSQTGDQVEGTFRTTTGDYRYLQGIMDGDSLKLSTFDGAHVFLFEAHVRDSLMEGVFYSGNHWVEPFTARLNPVYELPDPLGLTGLKEGWETLAFSFPDEQGQMISLADPQFEDQVVVVQLMGSWCPNCLEESRFYASYNKQHRDRGLKFVALAFEYAPDQERAWKGLNRLKEKLQIEYPILLAQYGSSDKEEAAAKLPMLDHVLSYPTTLFIDRKGEVRRIHTGINGEATGRFESFQEDFDLFVQGLLNE